MAIDDRKEVPEEVRQRIGVVNATVTNSAEVPVLIYWYDLDEAIGWYLDVYHKSRKVVFEGQHIAVGTLTGEPVQESYRGPHWCWELPTGQKHELLIWPEIWRWKEVDMSPISLAGTYPSFEIAEETNWDPLGKSTIRDFRSAQIVIGLGEILEWLRSNRHTSQQADELFDQVLEKTELLSLEDA